MSKKGWAMRSYLIITVIITGCSVLAVSGCDSAGGKKDPWSRITELGHEKIRLKRHIVELKSDNEQMARQIEDLTALSPEVRREGIAGIERIEISRRSGLYDKDKDGTKEKLIVYVKPIDETGDAVKAAGLMSVQLWDLNAETDQRLSQWDIDATELKKLWASTVMTNYYRLTFDISEILTGDERELTVKVAFTDYITGKIVREQKVIKE